MAELRLFGRSAAPGVAKGVVAVLDAARRPRRKAAGTQAEEALALQRALSRALAEVEALAGQATGEAADMLGFQVAMLSDEELVGPALERVEAGESAAAAWEAAMEAEIAGYRNAGDDHFSARTADLEDIRDRVLGHLEPGAASAVIPARVYVSRPARPWLAPLPTPRNDVRRIGGVMLFDTKIAVVIRTDLEACQKLNAASFLAGGIAAAFPESTRSSMD